MRFRPLEMLLDQFCTWVQLFSPRLRATVERKLKYENVHTIEQAPSNRRCRLARRGSSRAISTLSLRVVRNSNRW
jgi:hypothetical protein